MLLLGVAAAGCQSLPTPGMGPGSFSLKGKVAVTEGAERYSANVLWLQDAEDFRIDLWGPLGQGRVRLVKRHGAVRLETGSGEVLAEGPPERVMREHLGWSLPVGVLPAWVQGAPLDTIAVDDLQLDASGRVTAFRQLGWQVTLEDYQALDGATGERQLPRRVRAVSEATSLRLVVAAWDI